MRVEFDKEMRKIEAFSENILQRSTALSDQQQPNAATRTVRASVSPLPQASVRPSAPGGPSHDITPSDNSPSTADRNDDNARGSSNPFTDIDSIDGPTIVVEVY